MPLTDRLREHLEQRRRGWRALALAVDVRDHTGTRARSLVAARHMRGVIARSERLHEGSVAFRDVSEPEVSVVVPVFNNWPLTRRCLASLWASAPLDLIEVIVVDDASTDATSAGLQSIPGIRLLANDHNLGFTLTANRGARAARGAFITFLNNDAVVLPGWLEALLDAMHDPTVGVAGSRLLFPSGRVQEAGCLVWVDGTGDAIGRWHAPSAPEYLFRRDVDYCSAAALMVRAALLREIGYFDERFAPAYYEDSDLCFAARARGWRVVSEPASTVVHMEGRTHGTELRGGIPGAHGKSNQERNRVRFTEKWSQLLQDHVPRPSSPGRRELWGSRRDPLPRVLVCDQFIPAPDRDSGSHRMDWMLRLLAPMTSRLTLVPSEPAARRDYAAPLRRAGVEVLTGSAMSFKGFLRLREGLYDLVLLSRPAVAAARIRTVRRHLPGAVVVFDTVDLPSARLAQQSRVAGAPVSGDPVAARRLEERLIHECDITAVVTEDEARQVQRLQPDGRTVLLPNVHAPRQVEPPGFDQRRGLLFIGSFAHQPNVDAVAWFADSILPRISRQLDVDLMVVGANPPPSLVSRCDGRVRFTGWVRDVEPLFDAARVFVAPLRFGAGMKGKMGQALAMGLPVVTTSLGAQGMDLLDGREVMLRDEGGMFADAVVELHQNRELWTALSTAGRQVVAERWTPDVMRERLQRLLTESIGYRT